MVSAEITCSSKYMHDIYFRETKTLTVGHPNFLTQDCLMNFIIDVCDKRFSMVGIAAEY